MDVVQLRSFIAVAEELHFGRAAERLHVAQPPLSRTIQQFERELGTRLFDRSTRSVRLTAAGQALLEPAYQVMESIRRAEAAVRASDSGEVGLVRLAFAGVSSYQLVAEWARVVRQHRPGIRLELYSQNFALPAMRKLINAEVDVALGRWDLIPAGIGSRIVSKDSLVVALPDTHRLAQAPSLAIADLRDEDFISLPPYEGAVLPDRLRRLAHEAGFSANVVQIAPDTQSALALVSAEVGCHLTLASVARHASQTHVEFVHLENQTLDVDLQLAWRSDDGSPALRSVLALADEFLAPDRE
ncbi:LysR substrate-binding domain-containing protein [Streptosporangium sp. NPDC087985]|uniref:LysR substrate-binding domain-containing protein n=1 Tax=Streptosporangium sp. NPDC087985 TaxID=3366196 RepID=UPI0037FF91BE